MRFTLFYHSLVSDWNHGNAHFLRGVATELIRRGHLVRIFEPEDGWSRKNLLRDHGARAQEDFHRAYPDLKSIFYRPHSIELNKIAEESDVVLVHEWNDPWIVDGFAEVCRQRKPGRRRFRVLFHDTHHRAVSDPDSLDKLQLRRFDGALVFGDILSRTYRQRGWSENVWTWHEAADTSRFFPQAADYRKGLVWIGNFGEDERARELDTFLFEPARQLSIPTEIYGVRYPKHVLGRFARDGIAYGGWLANFRVPEIFAEHEVTVHVPRKYYTELLPGIPTIRPFEAMACGIPLVTAPWRDTEGLFTEGKDYLLARDGDHMKRHLRLVFNDADYSRQLASHALSTIQERHTCAHRVDELLAICRNLGVKEESAHFPVFAERRKEPSTSHV